MSSGNKDEQFFSDGLSENLIVALSQFDGLTVIGRNSAFQFRDSKDDSRTIGEKLGVATLLEGSVQHAGDVVRVSAELINAANGHMLWSARYDRPYKDLFALQDDITKQVASALKARLLTGASAPAQTDRPPSANLDAYTTFLQGKFYAARFTEPDDRQAIAQFTAATRLDPHYALAGPGHRIPADRSIDPTLPGRSAFRRVLQESRPADDDFGEGDGHRANVAAITESVP